MAEEVRIKIFADDNASPVINKASEAIADFGSKSTSTFNKLKDTVDDFAEKNKASFQKMALFGTAALGGIIAAGKGFVDSAMESQRVVTQLDSVLKSTGNTAGLTSKEIQNMASEMQSLNGISDEAILTGQNMLLTFTNIGKDVFPQTTQIMLDMATAMNGGITPSAEQLSNQAISLGKAINDPIKGLTALTRVGVTFTAQQKEQITKLQESGDLMGAQKIILAELGKEFGGSATAQAKTFGGAMNSLSLTLGDIGEAIGTALLPRIQGLVDAIKPIADSMLKWANENPELAANLLLIGGAVAGIVAGLGLFGLALPAITAGITGLGAVLAFLITPVGLVIAAVVGLFIARQTNFLGIRDIVASVFTRFQGLPALRNTIVAGINAGLAQLGQFFSSVREGIKIGVVAFGDLMVSILGGIIGMRVGVFTAFFLLLTGDWQGAWDTISLTFTNVRNGIIGFLGPILEAVGMILFTARSAITTTFIATRTKIKDFFSQTWEGLKAKTMESINFIKNFFSGGGKAALEEGFSAMVSGLGNIAKTVLNSVIGVFEGFVNMAIEAVNKLIRAANAVSPIKIPEVPRITLGRLAHGGIAGSGGSTGKAMGIGDAIMAFAQRFAGGGLVGGSGSRDTVPALLTPGELVLNKAQQGALAGRVGGGGGVNIVVSGNSFYGDDKSFAEKIGDTIMKEFQQHYQFESF